MVFAGMLSGFVTYNITGFKTQSRKHPLFTILVAAIKRNKMNPQFLFNNINSKLLFTEAEFNIIAPCFHYREVKKKSTLITEGKRNELVYIVEEGLLCNYKTLDSGDK